MRILVTETRAYVVEVDSGPESYAARRADEFKTSRLEAGKWLAQLTVSQLGPQEYNHKPNSMGVRLVNSHGITSEARGMAPGEEVK